MKYVLHMRKMLKGVYMKFLARSAAAGAIACGLVLGSAALPSALHTTSVSYATQTKKDEDSAAVKAVKRAIKAELERVARHNANLKGTTVQWGDTLIDGNLDKVKELSLSYVTLDPQAITLLGKLTKLNALKLTNCGLTDLSSIVNGKPLTYLDVSGNKLEKLSGLPDSLKSLVANNNNIKDISGISSLTNLGLLQLRGNKLADTTENVDALTNRAKSINLCEVEL